MKRVIRLLAVLVTVVIAIAIGGLFAAQNLNAAVGTIPDGGVIFSVEEGERLNDIAYRLQDDGLIRSSLFLKLVSYLTGTQNDFRIGSYRIEKGTTTLGIHDKLVSGREMLIRVTIPEGWISSQIGERLEAKGITTNAAFLNAVSDSEILGSYDIPGSSAEGYLFPDTYLFPRNFPAKKVVKVLVDRFFSEMKAMVAGKRDMPDAEELHEIVVLASIIEREYRAPDEAKLMASVFYNRLRLNMRLQSCATVAYVITEELGRPYPEVLSYDDLELVSDYNTYRKRGLPPGPIANPGLVALDAAFFPARTDYLYFVLKDADAGRHVFTRSFNEHLTAKRLYLKNG